MSRNDLKIISAIIVALFFGDPVTSIASQVGPMLTVNKSELPNTVQPLDTPLTALFGNGYSLVISQYYGSLTIRQIGFDGHVISNATSLGSAQSGYITGYPSMASNATGESVVAGLELPTNSGNNRIYFQLFNSDGTRKGEPHIVPCYEDCARTLQDINPPHVAMDKFGNFAVIWKQTIYPCVPLCYRHVVVTNLFDPNGDSVRGPLIVNPDTEHQTDNSSTFDYANIAMNANGEFVVTWEVHKSNNPASPTSFISNLYAQQFDAKGNLVGATIQINDAPKTTQYGYHWRPLIVMDDARNIFVAWSGSDTDQQNIFAQRFDSSGSRITPSILRSANGLAIAMDPAGNFIFAWIYQLNGKDAISVQLYDHDGAPRAPQFIVTDDSGCCMNPSIAVNGSDRFVMSWIGINGESVHTCVYEGVSNNTECLNPKSSGNSKSGALDAVYIFVVYILISLRKLIRSFNRSRVFRNQLT